MKIKFIKNIILSILFSLIIANISFANGPGTIVNRIAVVGDSYAGHFNLVEGSDRFDYFIFPVGTIYNPINIKVFQEAINSLDTYILFATGVNDQALNTDIGVFEIILRGYIAEIIKRNKYLVFHTYMDYSRKKIGNGSSPPEEYDKVLKKLSEEFSNVLYIDMSGFNMPRYDMGDGLHYNDFFYDTLKAKLMFYVNSIESTVFNKNMIKTSGFAKKPVAVAGDSVAYNFYDYENKKDFELIDYTNSKRNLMQNKDSILRAINSDVKSIFISAGELDYQEQIGIAEFKDNLRECLNEACLNYKNVFLTSSLDYTVQTELPIGLSMYDFAVESIADEYPNACYINMRSYQKDQKSYYDTLYSLLGNMVNNMF